MSGQVNEWKRVQRAEEMGAYFMERLRMIDSDKIREVRGMGLIAIVNRQ